MKPWSATLVAAALMLAGVSVAACGGDTADAGDPGAITTVTAAPHGSHSGSSSAAPDKPLRSGERFIDLSLPKPYTPAAPNGGTDEYRCFLVDPKLTEPAYLTGSRFLPQNPAVVHHAIFFRLSPEQAGSAASLDAKTPGEGWTCFGDTGVPGQTAWVSHWAPGAGETLMPDRSGFDMPPGSKLVMQVHYNLLGADPQNPPTDRSGIRMRVAESGQKLTSLQTALAMAPIELPCEPGATGPLCDRTAAIADVAKRFGAESGGQVTWLNQMCNGGREPVPGNTQRCDHPVSEPGTITMAAGHMHLLGRSIKVELNPGTPQARTVLDVAEYNFDNQALLALAKPIDVNPGDTLRVTCTHDAGLRKLLPQLRGQPSRYVVWGEGTSDEMCLGVMVMAPRG